MLVLRTGVRYNPEGSPYGVFQLPLKPVLSKQAPSGSFAYKMYSPFKPILERFWERVEKSEGCWEWKGGKSTRGYGVFGKVQAHRFSWELHNGPIPEGLCVCHRCDNHSCIRPDHLFLGTQLDNMRDRKAKGRYIGLAGEKNPKAKIKEEQVRQIRAMLDQKVKCPKVAKALGISVYIVEGIASGRSWRTVK